MAKLVQKKARAAETVFDALALAILKGEIAVGAALPPERVLAERFDVARGTVRQAVHRLADAGLVHAHQGGATTVLEHESSFDVRVIELRYRLGPQDDREARELGERRILQGFALVYLASVRAKREDIERLAALVDAFVARGAPEAELGALDRAIWTELARASNNRVYQREVAFWFGLPGAPEASSSSLVSPAARAGFYRELFRRLLANDAAPRYYLDVLSMLVPQ